MIKAAIILAGGKGERLRPFTNDRPKVMVELSGKPIILWQIEWLRSFGIKTFVIASGYKHEVIEEFLGTGSKFGVEIFYSVEDEPLGTGGATKKAFQHEALKEAEDLVVTNGDIITQFDISKMITIHEKSKPLVTLLLTPYFSRWGIAELDGTDHILGFKEKPKLPYFINGGIFVYNRKIENYLPEVGNYETETYPKIPSEEFQGFKDESFWRAVDMIKDKTEAEEYLKAF